MSSLSPEKPIEIFQDSFERCEKEDFLMTFYKRFVNISPEIQEKFEGVDLERMRDLVYESLYFMMMASNETTKATADLDQLGEFHAKHGVTRQMYDTWLDCLVDTAREYDPNWNEKVEDCWRAVMKVGIDIMKEQAPH